MSREPTYAQQALAEIQRRDETDYYFEWPSYFGWNFLTLGFIATFGGVYSHAATHRLIVRRRDHVERRLRLFSYLWHALAEKADELDRRADVQDGLDNLATIHSQIQSYERSHQRDPRLWTMLRATMRSALAVSGIVFSTRLNEFGDIAPDDTVADVAALVSTASLVGSIVVGTVINNFLHQDFRFLETWEGSYGENAMWVFGRLGTELAAPARGAGGRDAVPMRSTWLFLMLSIVTVGFFSIFWRYTVMTDGNAHFRSDAAEEDVLASALRLTFGVQVVPPPRLP